MVWNKPLTLLIGLVICFNVNSQTAPFTYLVSFTDKNASPFSISYPSVYLSQRAIDRRNRQNISIDISDLPVNPNYLFAVDTVGTVKIVCKSKWLNNVTIQIADTSKLNTIRGFSFVKNVVRNRTKSFSNGIKKFEALEIKNQYLSVNTTSYYGFAESHIKMMNGQMLHDMGFTGSKMLIAVIDNGFVNVNSQTAFQHLYNEGKIIEGVDFAHRDGDVYLGGGTHGSLVFSCMASKIPGTFVGTAPDASYILLVSENDTSEFPVEEDFWLAAAEWADSAGADVFNTSLGYTTFDDSLLNHNYTQLDGNTTRITRGVDLAAKKGIISVNSAGNSGASSWYYITAPADADSNLTVGAVGPDKISAFFSSRGPSADGRIKPNVCAQGYQNFLIWTDGTIAPGNGTSFSSPVLAGLTACLWEAFPEKTNMQIIRAIEQSATHYPTTDDSTGFGVPDMAKAYRLLSNSYSADGFNLMVLNNPFINNLSLYFYCQTDLNLNCTLYDLNGKKITNEKFDMVKGEHRGITLDVHDVLLQSGIYILKIETQIGSCTIRVVKS